MRVDNSLLNCTAFLGYPTERGFYADGTCFLVYWEQDELAFAYALTAAHVVWPDRLRAPPDAVPTGQISLRLSTEGGEGPKTLKTNRSDWVFHLDKYVDVCVLPLDLHAIDPDRKMLSVGHLNIQTMAPPPELIAKGLIDVGDEVAIVGLFTGRVGEKKNIPIVRVGNIAAMPEEPITYGSPRKPAYLVETRSLGGISGSPVLLNLEQNIRINQLPFATKDHGPRQVKGPRPATSRSVPYCIVGMIIGAHGGQYITDFVSESDTEIEPRSRDAEFNAGISVAIPTSVITEFLSETPQLKESRDKALTEERKRSGFRPTSANRGPKKSSEAAEPGHRERFNRLLGAAVKPPKSSD